MTIGKIGSELPQRLPQTPRATGDETLEAKIGRQNPLVEQTASSLQFLQSGIAFVSVWLFLLSAKHFYPVFRG